MNCELSLLFYVKISCGRCGENMSYAEYTNKHRNKHYNLCWLDGEEKLVCRIILSTI